MEFIPTTFNVDANVFQKTDTSDSIFNAFNPTALPFMPKMAET